MIPVGSIIDIPLPLPFQSRLKFVAMQRHSDGEIFVSLLAPLIVNTRIGEIKIEKGFLSDGASIPKLARKLVGNPFDFSYLAQAIVHDAFYRKGFMDKVKRKTADLIFRDLLWNTKIPFWKIPPFYMAVKTFGWRSFKKVSDIHIDVEPLTR